MWEKAKELVEQAINGQGKLSTESLELLTELAEKQINVSGYAMDMIKSSNFLTSQIPSTDTVSLTVKTLGLTGTPTTDQVYARAEELGLELCASDVGIYKRLKYTNQPNDDWEYMAMKQIADRDAGPYVFDLARYGVGLWLSSPWADPERHWNPDDRFVFSLRPLRPRSEASKSEPQKLGLFDRLLRR